MFTELPAIGDLILITEINPERYRHIWDESFLKLYLGKVLSVLDNVGTSNNPLYSPVYLEEFELVFGT